MIAFQNYETDYIGYTAVHLSYIANNSKSYEIGLQVAGKTATTNEAAIIEEEVKRPYTTGPAGGGSVRKHVNEVVGIISTLMDRKKIQMWLINKRYNPGATSIFHILFY